MAVKEKILVVDDEPSIRKYLQTLLEVDGFDVETVSSGKEALGKISAGERPDFIILDVLMPEMNGLDTLKELMQLDRSLNVIMLSCSNEVGTVVEAIRIGAHDYLTKPFEADPADRARRCAGVYLRGKRRGERSGGADDSSALVEAQPAIREGELRGAARRVAGIRVVWF